VGQVIPAANGTEKRSIPLTDLAPASVLGTSRNLYGTAAGGAQLKLVAALNTTDSTYLVVTPDASLGADAPTVNTAAAGQITTSAPLGPTTTTARRFYMSLAGGGARKLALTIANNTDITGTITASDATLAAAGAEPSTDTSGLSQPSGQVVAGATSILVAGLGGVNGFQSTGGWAIIGNGQHAIRYAGITAGALSGIPASGAGSIPATIPYNSQITAAPALMLGSRILHYHSTIPAYAAGTTLRRVTVANTRLGQRISRITSDIAETVTLRLFRTGAPVGSVWVTLQTGDIGPAGTVLGTSALVDVSTVNATDPADVTFTMPSTVIPAGTAYIVLHGDYALSDTAYIDWRRTPATGGGAFRYEGTIIEANSIFLHLIRGVSLPILYSIHKGDPVNLWITVVDTAAQAGLAALLDDGSDGVRVAPPLQDRRKGRAEALAQATAYLDRRAYPNVTLSYLSKDVNHRAGLDVIAALVPPTSANDTFKVQAITISNFTPNIPPDYTVTASDEMFSVSELLEKD